MDIVVGGNEMSRPLTEQQVLKKLKIDDFRHLTKDKVIDMASMLDKMDPEVAKKALEQFPDFANTMKDVLVQYKENIDALLKENGDSVKAYYDSCDAIISTLQKELEREELTFDERKYIIDKILEVAQMKGRKDSENKKFLATLAICGVATVTVVAGILAAVLGTNTQISGSDNDEF